jgi:dihydroorotase
MPTITLRRPDDWHIHLRDGAALATTVPHCATRFGRAIVMPNLKPPVVSVADAQAYRSRILAALPNTMTFQPLMTLYLTDSTPPDEIDRAKSSGIVAGVKLYPAGATTHSAAGVTQMAKVLPVLKRMAEVGIPLLVHGEVTDPTVDVFDRERVFLERELAPLLEALPQLKVVVEHITTQEAVNFVTHAGANVAATITAHHLLHNRNDMFRGGIRPHYYCLPVLKRETHRQALVAAATGSNRRFFLGTDSAPHTRASKEHACGCAGIYTAHAGIELYAEVFAGAGALDRLEDFASCRGADFYGLPYHEQRITVQQEPWVVPTEYPFAGETLSPLRAGEMVHWRIVS